LANRTIFLGKSVETYCWGYLMKTRAGNGVQPELIDGSAGLFRAILGGPGATLADAFNTLERATGIDRHPTRKLLGTRITLRPEEGEGYYDLTRIGEGVYVVALNFTYKDPRVELVPGDGLVQFYFKLSGDLTLGVTRTEPLRLNRPSLLVYHQPTGVDFKEWTAPSALERSVAITLRSSFLVENFLSPNLEPSPQLKALAEERPAQFQYVQLPLTAQMFDLATKLVDNPYSGALRLVNTEALTLELLCATVHGFTELSQTPNEEYSERDLRCLHAARTHLMKQLSPAPTICQVARAAGMNETSLKHGFKAVYGETIFEFSVRCRMQHALSLLRERRMPVARIAEAVGYAHQTSFATAFRRHFDVSPRDMRPHRRR
jgi:AraC-like DNA-binding protein